VYKRQILHHPAFQALEAAWRGVHYLITNLELDENLQLHLLNLSRAELAADLHNAGTDLSQAALQHVLIEAPRQAPDSTPWALLLGDYHFDESANDVAQLAALGALAAQAKAPFIAAAKASIVGSAALHSHGEPRDWQPLEGEAQERWQALRKSPQAAWLGLALPRLLLRLPYGKGGEHVEQFEFAESTLEHDAFLWGNPSLGCGLLLAQAFQEDGWQMQAGGVLDLSDMPAYTYKLDGETHLLPAAETCLLERASEAIAQAGLMPMLSYKNRNAVRLLRFQSIALPVRALAGSWQS
jgi:type VI secretion system protein ImpC